MPLRLGTSTLRRVSRAFRRFPAAVARKTGRIQERRVARKKRFGCLESFGLSLVKPLPYRCL